MGLGGKGTGHGMGSRSQASRAGHGVGKGTVHGGGGGVFGCGLVTLASYHTPSYGMKSPNPEAKVFSRAQLAQSLELTLELRPPMLAASAFFEGAQFLGQSRNFFPLHFCSLAPPLEGEHPKAF